MRDTYTAEKNRMKKSLKADPGSDDVYRTKLSWYPFADTFFNGTEVKSSDISLTIPETIDDPLGPEDEDCTIIPPYGNQYDDLEEMEANYDDQSTFDSSEPVHRYPKTRSKPNAIYEQEIPTDVEIEPDDPEDLYNSFIHDEFYYFGMNVASQLRALPKINALVLQDKIHKLIFDERLQFESHSTFHQHHTDSAGND